MLEAQIAAEESKVDEPSAEDIASEPNEESGESATPQVS
jgi:hypothetical protein